MTSSSSGHAAQIFGFLASDGTVHFEAPSANGTRKRVASVALHDLPRDLVAELIDQRDRFNADEARKRLIAERERKATAERVFATTWRRHSLDLAERAVPALAGKFTEAGERRKGKDREHAQALAAAKRFSDLEALDAI